jgi:uncharacterized protein
MPYLNFSSARPFVKLIVTLLSIVSIGTIVYFAGILFLKMAFSLHLDDVNHAMFGRYGKLTDPQLKTIQLFQTLGFFLLPGIFLHWLFSSSSGEYFGTSIRINPAVITWTLLTIVLALPFINWVVYINDTIQMPGFLKSAGESLHGTDKQYEEITNRLLSASNIGALAFNIVMVAILPAIGEEFIFRGIFQGIFSEITKGKYLPVIFTAILFSVFHGQFHGFIARFLLGIFLGYLFIWGKTIWLPVLAHFLYNTLNIFLYYFLDHANNIGSGTEVLNKSLSPAIVLVSFLLMSVSLLFIRKTVRAKEAG